MDKVVAEIIIGAVILTLLVAVIPIYKNSAKLVCEAGEEIDINENLTEVNYMRLPLENDYISGRYLSELVQYFKKTRDFEVMVIINKDKYFINKENVVDKERIKEDMIFKVKKADYDKKNIEMRIELFTSHFMR